MGAVTTAGPLAIFAWTMHLFASSSESASSTCDGASFLSSWTWSASVQMDQQPLLGDLLAPLLVPLVPQQPLLAPLLVPLVHLRTPPPPSLHFLSRPALCFLQEAQDVASLWASHALVFAFPSGNPRVLLLHHEQKAAGGFQQPKFFKVRCAFIFMVTLLPATIVLPVRVPIPACVTLPFLCLPAFILP